MRRSNFALRLQPLLLDEARKVAEAEGVALNQFINGTVAEKLSALRTERYFQERARPRRYPARAGYSQAGRRWQCANGGRQTRRRAGIIC
jgi:hypothetical protein